MHVDQFQSKHEIYNLGSLNVLTKKAHANVDAVEDVSDVMQHV